MRGNINSVVMMFKRLACQELTGFQNLGAFLKKVMINLG